MNKVLRKIITVSSITFVAFAMTAPSAIASEKGYRYWGYFQAKPHSSTWIEAQTGPSISMPDGSVEGWAFTFSGGSVKKAATPKIKPTFDSLCGATKAVAGKKRVGVVIDFGNPLLTPKGESTPSAIATCVVVEKKAIGLDVLAKVVKVRASASGFVCGFNSYPKKECGVEISTPAGLLKK